MVAVDQHVPHAGDLPPRDARVRGPSLRRDTGGLQGADEVLADLFDRLADRIDRGLVLVPRQSEARRVPPRALRGRERALDALAIALR